MTDLLTIPEVAALAGVSRAAVLYAIRDGRIAGAFRLGRTWAVPRAAAEAYTPRAGNRRRAGFSRRVPRDPA